MGVEGGQQQGRWAPFPVQDWSAMPPARPGPRFAPPDPAWGPPAPVRRVPPRWLPGLVVGLCLVLLAAGLYRVDRIGVTAAEVVDRFVPSDGAVAHLETTRGPADDDHPARGTSVLESARTVGAAGLLSLDFTLGTEVIGSIGGERVDQVPFWRTTRTPVQVGGAGAGDPDGAAAEQTTWVHDLTRAVELVAESGPERSRVYSPALVLLPASVADLDLDTVDDTLISWDGSGNVAADQTYSATFTGRVDSPGCVRVDGEIDYVTADRATSTRTLSHVWCTGRGVVESTDTEDGVRTTARPTSAPVIDVDTTPPDTDWADPRDWRMTEVAARSAEPHLGEGMLAGAPGSLPPVWTTAGVLVRVSSSQDLIGLRPRVDGASVVSRWRAHPGGTVVSLAAYGDLLVAATSERAVVAHTADGVRLWTTELPDVAFSTPAVVDDLLLVTTLSGHVHALDRQTGEVRWQTALRSDIARDTAVAADPERVLVMARSGDLVALDTRTGSELWRTEVESGVLVALSDGQVVVGADLAVWGLSAADGTIRWRVRTGGTPHALQVDGDRLLVWAQEELLSLGTDGVQHWVRPATAPAVASGDWVVVINGDALEAVDASGATVVDAGIPSAGPGSNRQVITTPDGVWFVDNMWDSWRWSR